MTAHSSQKVIAATFAAGHLLSPVAIEVAEHIGFRGALAACNPAFRKYGSYDTLITGRGARRMGARLLANTVKKAGHCEQLL